MKESIIKINKNVLNENNCRNEIYFYEKARIGFLELLKELKKIEDYTILLPAYIGYSPNEGSGIDDPIEELNYKSVFYNLDSKLNIDFQNLKEQIKSVVGPKILLIVHYFGYVDENIEQIVNYAKENNVIIIEDCAHAFFTNFVDNKCGMYGDFCIYSLHKMFPTKNGGMLKINNDNYNLKLQSTVSYDLFTYDFNKIAAIRKRNVQIIYEKLRKCPHITILKNDLTVTPQTFPILIDKKIKEKIYFKMNEEGYQLVALYFRLIPQINKSIYKDTYKASQEILNLPVHQDIEVKDIETMCDVLLKCVEEFKNEI